MRAFSSGELSRLQATQETAMQDECQILDRTAPTTDDYGLPEETFTPGSALACGFRPVVKEESMGESQVAMIDAELRLPLSAEGDIASVDRIKITKRFRVTINPQPVYEVVGLPERGPSGLVLNLKLVTDGSS